MPFVGGRGTSKDEKKFTQLREPMENLPYRETVHRERDVVIHATVYLCRTELESTYREECIRERAIEGMMEEGKVRYLEGWVRNAEGCACRGCRSS